MTEVVNIERRNSPLLISIPHDGREIPDKIAERMTPTGLSLPDTDWHVRKLYRFAENIDATVLAARFSRYVIDLNRPKSDAPLYVGQTSTGLCPSLSFSGERIYRRGHLIEETELNKRTREYWQPYHDALLAELGKIRDRVGYALLWDAHSIKSRVPNLFEGTLPDLNIGTNDGLSCDSEMQRLVTETAHNSGYSVALNGRFKGGYITRTYGNPQQKIHAIQLELAQKTYMDEQDLSYDESAAECLIRVIHEMLRVFSECAEMQYKK